MAAEDPSQKVTLVAGLGCAVLFGGSMLVGGLVAVGMALFRDPIVYVHHDGVGDVEVRLDGAPAASLRAAGATEVRVPRGDHHLSLVRGTARREVPLPGMNGLDDLLLPTDPATCFVQLDVTWALYGDRPEGGGLCGANLDQARIIDTWTVFPREVGGPVFEVADLPGRHDLSTLVTLERPWPCAELDTVTAAAVLGRALGCPAGSNAPPN